jgi:hypothetical protein
MNLRDEDEDEEILIFAFFNLLNSLIFKNKNTPIN